MDTDKHIELVEEIDSPYGAIEIGIDRRTGAVAYDQGDVLQSRADQRGISLAPYIHALFDIVRQSGAETVLLIGCGGGTLGTMLSGLGIDVTIVDIDPISFEIAHHYFGLPHSVTCHVADGAAFVRRTRMKFDAIVLDAYHEDRIPAPLTHPAFLVSVQKHLTGPDAVFAANVFVRNDKDDAASSLVSKLEALWPGQVRWLDRPGKKHRNAIVMAGGVTGLKKPRLVLSPDHKAGKIRRWLKRALFQGEDRES